MRGPASGTIAPERRSMTAMTATTDMTAMTAEQRRTFEKDGYVVVRGALGCDEVESYASAVDAAYHHELWSGGAADDGSLQKLDAVAACPAVADLVDHPATFPLVWSVLGWNVHMYHSHLDVHPPPPEPPPFRWRWHQDGGRQNIELETDPRPRMAVYVAFWLSDVSQAGRGNLAVIPGSHRINWLPGPPGPTIEWPTPDGAVEVTAEPGDAVMFDRRIWHVRSVNHSDIVRKAVFFGYTYRWVVRRDGRADHLPGLTPIQRQLLGAGDGTGDGQWGHRPDDVPLYVDLRARGLLDPANRPLKRLFP
jgi:ectoine hydroxylase-related dioxygenase (phytanoyl-CoA dioxygenase family)